MPIPWEISTCHYAGNNTNTSWYEHNPKEALSVETANIP